MDTIHRSKVLDTLESLGLSFYRHDDRNAGEVPEVLRNLLASFSGIVGDELDAAAERVFNDAATTGKPRYARQD